jgi:4-diphosphocytidyl-2-C-methyl-D-erythritol kinase
MLSERTAHGLVVRAPAKVNLFLEVRGQRPDGYHELATLLVAVSLCDTLEFTEERPPSFALQIVTPEELARGGDRPRLDGGPDNLVWRAAELLRRRTGHRGGARVRLHKRIPLEAGLAGGSSDAAAALWGLNRLWGLGLSRQELAGLGAELGSDVAFFLAAPPAGAAWCTGRGEVVAPLALGRPLWLVLVCPPEGLSTAAVFGALTVPEGPQDGGAIREAAARGDLDGLARGLHNRLQPVAERLCPAVAEAGRRLAAARPAGWLMSGSGTTVFALCRDHGEAVRVAREVAGGSWGAGSPRVFIVRSCR